MWGGCAGGRGAGARAGTRGRVTGFGSEFELAVWADERVAGFGEPDIGQRRGRSCSPPASYTHATMARQDGEEAGRAGTARAWWWNPFKPLVDMYARPDIERINAMDDEECVARIMDSPPLNWTPSVTRRGGGTRYSLGSVSDVNHERRAVPNESTHGMHASGGSRGRPLWRSMWPSPVRRWSMRLLHWYVHPVRAPCLL